ncbi:MAG: hypothetical protein ACLFSQ_08050 [Candidatus Zixiibacteriota bacterium]
MAKKKRMFIDKIVGKKGDVCPVCGETRKQVKVISSFKHDNKSWRYDNKMKRVCACNKKEVFS